jgi:hypothetical protein
LVKAKRSAPQSSLAVIQDWPQILASCHGQAENHRAQHPQVLPFGAWASSISHVAPCLIDIYPASCPIYPIQFFHIRRFIMSQRDHPPNNNPFVRGFQRLSVQRLVGISTDPGTPLLYLPLHPSQEHVQDADINQRPINYGNHFALHGSEPYASSCLLSSCQDIGWVQTVVYALITEVDGKPIPVCDTYSSDAAQKLIQTISFDNGTFSRCWEISTAHVCQQSLSYLHGLTQTSRLCTKLFEVFRVPAGNLIGIKFLNTPWTDSNLQALEGKTAQDLRTEHERSGIPPMLLNVLHLAGEADVRFLFLDPDGFVLNGLPIIDDGETRPDQGEFFL